MSGARDVFDAGLLARLDLFVRTLVHWNRKFSLTSVPDGMIFEELVAPSAWLGLEFAKKRIGVVADFGSGAGIPGIPMAIADSRNDYLLLDSNEKKIGFLKYCAAMPGVMVGKVAVERIRVEKRGASPKASAVVTRGTGRMVETCELWRNKLIAGGAMFFFKGEGQVKKETDEIAARFKGADIELLQAPEWFGRLRIVKITPSISDR